MGPTDRIPSAAPGIGFGGLPSSSCRHHHKCEGSHSGVRSAHFRDIAVVGSLPSSAWRRVVVTCTGPTDRVPSAALVIVFGDLHYPFGWSELARSWINVSEIRLPRFTLSLWLE